MEDEGLAAQNAPAKALWRKVHHGCVSMPSMIAHCRDWNILVPSWLDQRLKLCMTCQRHVGIRFTQAWGELPPVHRPNERVDSDFIGLIQGSYICVIMDLLTRVMQATVTAKTNALAAI